MRRNRLMSAGANVGSRVDRREVTRLRNGLRQLIHIRGDQRDARVTTEPRQLVTGSNAASNCRPIPIRT